jgi:hypothetical protein
LATGQKFTNRFLIKLLSFNARQEMALIKKPPNWGGEKLLANSIEE